MQSRGRKVKLAKVFILFLCFCFFVVYFALSVTSEAIGKKGNSSGRRGSPVDKTRSSGFDFGVSRDISGKKSQGKLDMQ